MNEDPPISTVTTTAMLNALTSPDNQAVWDEFVGRYRPVLIGFARTWGLKESDAEDVAQQTLAEFSRDLRAGKYTRGKGRLRAWMIGIARHRMVDVQRQLVKRREWRGDSVLIDAADENHVVDAWEEAQKTAIFQRSLEILRTQTRLNPTTIQAFELTVLRNVPTAEVARQCGISESEVYVAKSRVATKLKDIVEKLRDAYTREE